MHLSSDKFHGNRAKTNLNLGLYHCSSEASVAKCGTQNATINAAMWCTLPPPLLPLKRQ